MAKVVRYCEGGSHDLKRVLDKITLAAGGVAGGVFAPGLSVLFKNQLVSCSIEETEGEPERIVITIGEFEFCTDDETFDFFSCDQEGSRGILITSKDEKTSIWIDEEVLV